MNNFGLRESESQDLCAAQIKTTELKLYFIRADIVLEREIEKNNLIHQLHALQLFTILSCERWSNSN